MARLLQVELHPERYKSAVALVLAPGILCLLALAIWLFTGVPRIHLGPVSIPYGFLFLLCVPYYLASSFFPGADELVGITVLKVPAVERTGGFTFAPLWLTELHRFPRSEQEDQFPGEPEQISNMTDEEADRTKSVLLEPIRITTGGPEQGDDAEQFKDDLLNERLTLEPTIVVHWQVGFDLDLRDGYTGFFNFYVNMPGGDTWAEKYRAVLKRMRDTAEGVLNSELSKHSAAWAIANKDVLVTKVAERLSQMVSDWSINLCEVEILNLVPHHSVNTALGAIPEAKARGQAEVISATNQKVATITRAEGEKAAAVLKDTGRGEGIAAFAKATGVEAETILRIDAAVEIGKNGKNINIGNGLMDAAENLLGALR